MGIKDLVLPQLTRVRICLCLYRSIRCQRADRLHAVSLNSGQLLEKRTKDDGGVLIPATIDDLQYPFFHPQRTRLQHSPIKR